MRSNCYTEDLADLAYITAEAFPNREGKGETRVGKRIEEYKTIYRPPHVTRPVSENKLATAKHVEVPRTPPVDTDAAEYRRNEAKFHMDEARLNSPGMMQSHFESNAARFHSNTPIKKDAVAFKSALDPLFPPSRSLPPPPNTQSSQYQHNKSRFYGVTPVSSQPCSSPSPTSPPS